jgi:hypothetical protein
MFLDSVIGTIHFKFWVLVVMDQCVARGTEEGPPPQATAAFGREGRDVTYE